MFGRKVTRLRTLRLRSQNAYLPLSWTDGKKEDFAEHTLSSTALPCERRLALSQNWGITHTQGRCSYVRKHRFSQHPAVLPPERSGGLWFIRSGAQSVRSGQDSSGLGPSGLLEWVRIDEVYRD